MAAIELQDISQVTEADLSQTTTLSKIPSANPEDETSRLASDLPPVDYGRGVWSFAISACAIEACIWGYSFAYGTYQEYYLSTPPFNTASTAAISSIGTIALALQYIGAMFYIPLYRRYPEWSKTAMIVALGFLSLSFVVSSFANQVWQLILLQGVVCGISAGIIYAPLLLLNEWTDQRRGLIGGVLFGGTGIGGAICPLLISSLLDSIGFRWTLRIWAALVLVIVGVAFLFCNPRIPARSLKGARPPMLPPNLSVWRNPTFWLFTITIALQSFAFIPISIYLPTYATSLGLSRTSGNLALSLFNASCVVAQFGIGWLCDKRSYSGINAICCFLASLVAFLLFGLAAKQLATVLVFAMLFGSIAGGFSSSWPHAAKSACEPGNAGEIGFTFALFGATKGVTSIIGPIIAAELYVPTTTRSEYGAYGFRDLFLFVGSSMFFAAVCECSTFVYSNRSKGRSAAAR